MGSFKKLESHLFSSLASWLSEPTLGRCISRYAPLPYHMASCNTIPVTRNPPHWQYNTILRGVSVQGMKAPLDWLFDKLCMGNRYTNTVHCISNGISKLSRMTRCDKVYRAPGGILPKFFWEDDPRESSKGGVEYE